MPLLTAKVSFTRSGPQHFRLTDCLRIVTLTVHSSEKCGGPVEVVLWGQDGHKLANHSGEANKEFNFTVRSPKLWWPESPTLYNLTVKLGGKNGTRDEVTSYTGFRTISKGKVEGVTRHLLNGEFVFQFGTLDQGYWPDGLYTPPNREAMIYDLKILKKLGFNMLRKHVGAPFWLVSGTG